MESQHTGENKKAKTHKGRIYLQKLMPKAVEDPKECLFINSDNTGEIMRMVMNDLVRIKLKNFNFYLRIKIVYDEKRIL